MLLDAQLLFSDAQAVTATAASTNLIDLFSVQPRIGDGQELYIQVSVDVAFTDASSNSTITVTVEQDDNAAFSSAATVQTIGTFAALTAAGSRLVARLSPLAYTERYIRLMYTTANGDLTTGSFTAGVLLGVDSFFAHAKSAGAVIDLT